MNNKILRGSLAGVAVVALAAGGSTFASWSDFDTITGSNAGADELSLVLNEPNTQEFDNMRLAPGVGNDFEFVVASRQGETIKEADLKMQLTNLVGKEDGCTSANSEAVADANCNDTTSEGEFLDAARIGVNVSQPTTNPNACDSATNPRGSAQTAISLRALRDNSGAVPLDLGTLEKGEYICVAMGLNMPASAGNGSQGDSGSFDLKFLLEQVV